MCSLFTVPYGNHGCACGDINNAFLYVIDNDGVDTYSSYPFRSKVSSYLSVQVSACSKH